MEYGQESTGIFNDVLVAPHFVNIALPPISTAPREGALAFDETTQQLYYSRAFKWVPITSGMPGTFPFGYVVETTSPSGSTFVGRTIVSGSPQILVTNGNGVAGNTIISFTGFSPGPGDMFPAGIIVETTSPSGTTFVGRSIVSNSPEIVVTNANGISGDPTLTFNSGAMSLPVLPQGLIAEQVGPSGNVYNGVTITSIDPELVVTNGNGVGGNPTLNINLTPVGKLLGGTVQTDINYLGEVYNANNGFSLSTAIIQFVTSTAADASAMITGFAVSTAQNYSDGNFNTVTGAYTVPISGRWEFGGNIRATSDATNRGSLIVWGGVAATSIPAMFPDVLPNDFTWGFATQGHYNADDFLQLSFSAVGFPAGNTTAILAGSSIYGRLIQPDA
jgi:hypothetical protein